MKLRGQWKRWAGMPDRHAWRHEELQVRPVPIDAAKDPRYRRERSGGYGSTVPYLPNRLGLPARRTGKPVADAPPRLSVARRRSRRATAATPISRSMADRLLDQHAPMSPLLTERLYEGR